MIFAELIAKINQLFGYTPTQAQLLANPDLLEIAMDAAGVDVNSLTDIANSLNTLLGTAYTAAQLTSRPDLIRLGLKSLQANLPNGTLINGVSQIIYTPTIEVPRPQTRPTINGGVVGGSALVIGDRWVNPSTGVEGFWNGTYWLGERITIQSPTASNNYTGGSCLLPRIDDETHLFVHSVSTSYYTNTATNSSNYGIITIKDGSLANIVVHNYQSVRVGEAFVSRSLFSNVNQVFTQIGSERQFYIFMNISGSISSFFPSAAIVVSKIL